MVSEKLFLALSIAFIKSLFQANPSKNYKVMEISDKIVAFGATKAIFLISLKLKNKFLWIVKRLSASYKII